MLCHCTDSVQRVEFYLWKFMSRYCKNKHNILVNYQFENRTNSTATFPNTANRTTIQTEVRNHCEPITSSHGFNASGDGKHFTSIFLQNVMQKQPKTK